MDKQMQREELIKKYSNDYKCFPVYYPVGNGFFNAPKAIEDLKYISKL